MPAVPARAFAVALALLLGATLSGCGVYDQLTGHVTRNDAGTVTQDNKNADVFAMEVGDCLDDAVVNDSEITNVPIVTCAEPHDSDRSRLRASTLTEDAYPAGCHRRPVGPMTNGKKATPRDLRRNQLRPVETRLRLLPFAAHEPVDSWSDRRLGRSCARSIDSRRQDHGHSERRCTLIK